MVVFIDLRVYKHLKDVLFENVKNGESCVKLQI